MKFTTISNAKKENELSYLGNANISSKMIKNKKVSGQLTYIIYLAPAKTSGYQVCPFSTSECRKGCLATSGRAAMDITSGKGIIEAARIKKTRLLFEQQDYFMNWLVAELKQKQTKAKKDGLGISARLNGTSDIDWANVKLNGKNIFEIFPDVQFYDYTKSISKFKNIPKNYHLTFSYTGRNWDNCKELLELGHNVAIVFNVKNENELPETFNGYKVINGDATDYRVTDGKGVIVGLKFKHIADRKAEKEVKNSCFVVQPDNVQCTNVHANKLQLAA